MPRRFAEVFPFARAGSPPQTWAEGQDAALLTSGLAWSAASYSQCKVPVHVLTGDRDLVVNPRTHAHPLARVLPNARLTSLPGLGHMIHHFAQPAIAAAVRDLHGAA